MRLKRWLCASEHKNSTHSVVEEGAKDEVGDEARDGNEEGGEGAGSYTEVQTQEGANVGRRPLGVEGDGDAVRAAKKMSAEVRRWIHESLSPSDV